MEGFELKKESFFSKEQNEKLPELINIVNFWYSSVDSNNTFEISEPLEKLMNAIVTRGFKPENFLLWNILKNKDISSPEVDNIYFDTDDNIIENFIKVYMDNTPEIRKKIEEVNKDEGLGVAA
jgi:hypothetical protein